MADCVPGPDNPCGPWVISEDVTLLPPDDPKGMIVRTDIGQETQGDDSTSIYERTKELGLMSQNELLKRGLFTKDKRSRIALGIDPDRQDVIFFRPPYHKADTLEDQFFGDKLVPRTKPTDPASVTVRVDPERSYVQDSDVRLGEGEVSKAKLLASRKKLIDYQNDRPQEGYEVVAKVPRIGPAWFVHKDVQVELGDPDKYLSEEDLLMRSKFIPPPKLKPKKTKEEIQKEKEKAQRQAEIARVQSELDKVRAKGVSRRQTQEQKDAEIASLEAKLRELRGGRRKTRRNKKAGRRKTRK